MSSRAAQYALWSPIFGNSISKSILPTSPSMPNTPTKDDQSIALAALEAKQAARMRAGRASTLLTGGMGVSGSAPGQTKTLLGQ